MRKEHQPDPEALYNLYKETRSRTQRVGVAVESGATESSEYTPGDDIANKVYARYQETRNADADAIDEIMRGILTDPIDILSAPIEDQPVVGSAEAEVKSIGNTVGPLNWLSKLTNADNDTLPVAKFILPAVAAAVFAFVLLPLINAKNDAINPLANTAYLSPSLAPYVEPLTASMLGFSKQDNERGSAFQHGVLAADLQVFRNSAGSAEQLKIVVQSYLMGSSSSVEEVDLAAQQIVTLSSIAGDAEYAITPEMVESIDSLLSATREHTGYSEFSDWILLGQSVEAVFLSSEHALATSDTSILQSAIEHGKTLKVPDEAAELKTLFDDLFAETVKNSMPTADIRRIRNKAKDIKSVVL